MRGIARHGGRLRSHIDRGFELQHAPRQPEHPSHKGIVCHTFDKRKRQYGKTDEMTDFVSVTGGGNCTVRAALDAMGVPHRTELTKQEINEAIPPAYTAWLARQLVRGIPERRAAA